MLTTTTDGLLDNGDRVLGPYEWGRMTIPLSDIGLDVADQGTDGVERAAPDRLAGEDAEPRLDHVEPGGALRGEVELDRRMLGEPRLYRRGRMRGRVVEHDVQRAAALTAGDSFEEAQEIGAGVPRCTLADHATARDLQRRVQTCQAIAPVVVGLSGRQPGAQGQQRLGTAQRLDLRLLIERISSTSRRPSGTRFIRAIFGVPPPLCAQWRLDQDGKEALKRKP